MPRPCLLRVSQGRCAQEREFERVGSSRPIKVDVRIIAVKSYRWPGNVRELQNVLERAVIICESDTLTVEPRWLARETAKPVRPLGDELATRERQMIETALAESRGRVAGPTGAAAKLGLNPSTLDYKIRTLRIEKHRFKRS